MSHIGHNMYRAAFCSRNRAFQKWQLCETEIAPPIKLQSGVSAQATMTTAFYKKKRSLQRIKTRTIFYLEVNSIAMTIHAGVRYRPRNMQNSAETLQIDPRKFVVYRRQFGNIEAAKQPRFKTVLLDDIENASRRIPALIGKKT